jgi:Family of unknown function (DUF6527)
VPTLKELEGQFIAYFEENGRDMFRHVDSLSEAHGIHFICPKSFAAHQGRVGAHMMQLYFSGSPVPPRLGTNKSGQTVRWNVSGTCMDDLSLTPSIQEEDSLCAWHGFVGSSGVPPGNAQ